MQLLPLYKYMEKNVAVFIVTDFIEDCLIQGQLHPTYPDFRLYYMMILTNLTFHKMPLYPYMYSVKSMNVSAWRKMMLAVSHYLQQQLSLMGSDL